MDYKLKCEHCGKSFTSPNYWARYDTDACRQAAYRERKAEAERESRELENNEQLPEPSQPKPKRRR